MRRCKGMREPFEREAEALFLYSINGDRFSDKTRVELIEEMRKDLVKIFERGKRAGRMDAQGELIEILKEKQWIMEEV